MWHLAKASSSSGSFSCSFLSLFLQFFLTQSLCGGEYLQYKSMNQFNLWTIWGFYVHWGYTSPVDPKLLKTCVQSLVEIHSFLVCNRQATILWSSDPAVSRFLLWACPGMICNTWWNHQEMRSMDRVPDGQQCFFSTSEGHHMHVHHGDNKCWSMVSIISHCASRTLSEDSERYDVTLYVTMF